MADQKTQHLCASVDVQDPFQTDMFVADSQRNLWHKTENY